MERINGVDGEKMGRVGCRWSKVQVGDGRTGLVGDGRLGRTGLLGDVGYGGCEWWSGRGRGLLWCGFCVSFSEWFRLGELQMVSTWWIETGLIALSQSLRYGYHMTKKGFISSTNYEKDFNLISFFCSS